VANKTKLILPSPQLHDKELEEMGKLNNLQQGPVGSEDANATRFLVGNYTEKHATPTPIRTPKVENSILREARHAAGLRDTQTPLVGGEYSAFDDLNITSVVPKSTKIQTPNVLSNKFATPMPKVITYPCFLTFF